jgi:hypothetical protein
MHDLIQLRVRRIVQCQCGVPLLLLSELILPTTVVHCTVLCCAVLYYDVVYCVTMYAVRCCNVLVTYGTLLQRFREPVCGKQQGPGVLQCLLCIVIRCDLRYSCYLLFCGEFRVVSLSFISFHRFLVL